MTTNNHPANGPVSLERLHQIREILSKAAEQSDGGNLGYAMADAVKVIDGVIASSGMKPYGYVHKGIYESCGTSGLSNDHEAYCSSNTHIALYTAPPATVVPPEKTDSDYVTDCHGVPSLEDCAHQRGWNACRAAMLQSFGNSEQLDEVGSWNNHMNTPTAQAANSPVTPDCWCHTCRPVTMSDMRFVVCPDCGNKRCPHANDHRHACTGSNEPGQEGSAYQAAPQQEDL